MSERVARDGDTVTVRDCLEPDYPDDRLTVEPWDTPGLMAVRIGGDDDLEERLIIVDRADLAALAYHLLALAGDPDAVVLPSAEVEALRARCNRLIDELVYQMPECPTFQYIELHDMDDDLRPLDDLPPLKLAGNPLDVPPVPD